MSTITIDTSELRQLAAMLDAARKAAPAQCDAALDRVVAQVVTEARANADAVRLTGALHDHTEADTTGITRRIWSDVREAAFQEFGSPNTGPPNPWLTGPARAGSTRLLQEMIRIGHPW